MLSKFHVKTLEKDLERHWYSDDYFDLILWRKADGTIHGFQLCYDKQYSERALTWTREQGFRHSGIDAGESSPLANRTPILVADGEFPVKKVRGEFIARSRELPAEIRELVLARMTDYEQSQSSPGRAAL